MLNSKWLIALATSLGLVLLALNLEAESPGFPVQRPPTERHDTTLLKKMKDSDLEQRQYMIDISRQIGVTCTTCHDLKDFKKNDKPAYKIGKIHIEMVRMLNDKFAGKIGEKVDCYMCHKGVPKPQYKEKIGSAH